MPVRLSNQDHNFQKNFKDFLSLRNEEGISVDSQVKDILSAVAKNGDEALLAYTKEFDHFEPEGSFAFTQDQISQALEQVSKTSYHALEVAAERIRSFHEKSHPQSFSYQDEQGLVLGTRWGALDAVGLYVPGGTAAYPSSVLMNAIPAKVAGVERLVMVVPTPYGRYNPLVLAAAQLAGVDEVYSLGGAQAIGALAYGTESIQAVDKIVGPGNAYVASAKKQVFGQVGIDMVAGPSEVLVVADDTARADWIAIDLLSQAEHDKNAQSILITDSQDLANEVVAEVQKQLKTLPREEIARESWDKYGAVITVSSLEEAVPLVNQLAPEHLEIALDDPQPFFKKVRHAGSVFLGHYTPEALGDYVAGPNHVLPTSRSARFSSGLSVYDFLKRTTFIESSLESLEKIGPFAVTLAQEEGLEAHALSVSKRLKQDIK